MMVYPELSRGEFEELVRKFSPPLRRMARSLNGRLRYMDNDDLMQEAFSHLWIRYREGELKDKTDSYILQSCYFHLKNLLRKTREKADVISLSTPIDEEGTTLEEIISDESQRPANSIMVKLFIDQVRENGLSERERNVFSLYLEDLTTREIGKRLGISHVMVIKIEKRIRNKCKKFKEEIL